MRLGLGGVGLAGGGDALGGVGGEIQAGDEAVEGAELGIGGATEGGVFVFAEGGADVAFELLLRARLVSGLTRLVRRSAGNYSS